MNRFATAAIALSLVACSADWSGTYVGALSQNGTCPDGSALPEKKTVAEWTLHDDGDTLTWSDVCDTTSIADADGDVATVRPFNCPSETIDGTLQSVTVKGGTLTLGATSLLVKLNGTLSREGLVGSCDMTIEGELTRMAEPDVDLE
ncbi:hypothetical protein [Polyangium sp. y55x31]|uniref:hypothetical protein n=1 Tax=Polyangium sp. y55x31 TaxID=3042688 RepID=UPI002482A38E|nr:hypothetical protein [Polyangium sp. y55x31]MDI1476939.1 hypothetical protein [Polyangium sp. y55x31]